MRLLLALAPAIVASSPAIAQQAPVADAALTQRIEGLPAILRGEGDYAAYFSPAFQKAVPKETFASLTAQLATTLGRPLAIASVTPASAWSATVTVRYERGTATVQIVVDPSAPHSVTGLRVTGTELANDSWQKLSADLSALPGRTAFGVYRLGEGAPVPLGALHDETAMPIGSGFKLWVLGTLADEIAAGKRRWSDVVPIGAASLPSGVLQSWPAGAPVTLHTLATLMISVSDNTATDTLMRLLGRTAIEAHARGTGIGLPLLTTREAVAIKSDPALTARWIKASPGARDAILRDDAARFAGAKLDVAALSGAPKANDSVEWFASPRSIAGELDRLRRSSDPMVRRILAVNPGTSATVAERFGYLGYKGGSEPGVIALNYLVQDKGGAWFAVAGAWNRPDATVDEAAFVTTMGRALTLIAH